jgi:hypothetical protein
MTNDERAAKIAGDIFEYLDRVRNENPSAVCLGELRRIVVGGLAADVKPMPTNRLPDDLQRTADQLQRLRDLYVPIKEWEPEWFTHSFDYGTSVRRPTSDGDWHKTRYEQLYGVGRSGGNGFANTSTKRGT